MFLTEHENHFFDFCNPSRLILTIFREHARLFPALAGIPAVLRPKRSIRALPIRAGGQDDGSYDKLPQITASDITASDITASDITASDITASDIAESDITASDITASDIAISPWAPPL